MDPGVGRPLGKDVTITVEIDCSLDEHIDMICNILNIPLHKRQTPPLHLFFSLYSELKNSLNFKGLAEGKKTKQNKT